MSRLNVERVFCNCTRICLECLEICSQFMSSYISSTHIKLISCRQEGMHTAVSPRGFTE